MKEKSFFRILPEDNVAIAMEDAPVGTVFEENGAAPVTAVQFIPQAHKMALCDLPKGSPVIRYGVRISQTTQDIRAGEWVNEAKTAFPQSLDLADLSWGTDLVTELPKAPRTTFLGYAIPGEPYAGTRNLLGIVPTVQCCKGVLSVALEKMKRELLPRFPNVDDIVVMDHAYGCGVAINGTDAPIPIRAVRNMVHHPNFGGQIMVVSLGCEKLQPSMILDPEDNTPENVIVLQEKHGFAEMIDSLMTMAAQKLAVLDKRRRTELPLSKLLIGLQCGGSDAFSGITANPAAGYASDLLVGAGATVLFSEVTEIRDSVAYVAQRTVSEAVCDKLRHEMAWYDAYLEKGGVDRGANTTPGNKAGGLSNIIEKSLGSVAKSGRAPIIDVLAPAERPSKPGLIFAASPASDFACGASQLASGITLQVFMTGRGTPYGLAAAPVIKVCSRNELKERWDDLIDINAGPIATGEATVEEIGLQLFHEILDVASGLKKPWAEQYRLYNDFTLFNPAPVT